MQLLTDPLHLLPGPWRYGIMLAVLAGVWVHGFTKGKDGPERELVAVQAVATATDARYRALEKEVADAQRAHVDAWKSARRDADGAWMRLAADRRSRVPTVCAQPGSAETDRGDGLAATGEAGAGDVLAATLDALKRGEEIEATLQLCQAELRQCAGMR